MNDKPNQSGPPPVDPEPAWLRFWRANPGGKVVVHAETKGARKRARRERKTKGKA